MVSNVMWFEWASKDEKIAYIEGVGREATSNKHLKVLRLPLGKSVSYTPSGYVEHSFTWYSLRNIIKEAYNTAFGSLW